MNEFERITQEMLSALGRGELIALATVVQVRGSAPRHAGARMIVWPDGHIYGTVGGGTLEEKIVADSVEALQASHGKLDKYILSTDGNPESLGYCGGEVMVHIEILEPAPLLVMIGAGHIGAVLADMAPLVGMRVAIVDDRKEFLDRDRYPSEVQLLHVPYERHGETLDPIPLTMTPATYVIVATWGWDLPALEQVLGQEQLPAYVCLIGSKTKWRVIREMLAAKGVPEERLNAVHAPGGLDIGAETPGEIAVSILAEMMAVRRSASGQPLSPRHREALKAAAPAGK